jgi:Phosphotransferase enzyme family
MRRSHLAAGELILETMEYSLVLVEPHSRRVLALDAVGGYRLPRVRIPENTRRAEQLRKAVKNACGLHVLILDLLAARDGSPLCAVAEVLIPDQNSELQEVMVEQISSPELSELQRAHLTSLLSGDTDSPFAQIGWIEEAVAWMESVTHRNLSSKSGIEQYNVGGSFSLVRFHTADDWHYWLKATGEPNAHELAVTSLLSKLGEDYLPEMISSRPAWNAWLMSGQASGVTDLPSDPFELFRLLEDAVESMAELQLKTEGHGSDLLRAGAFDQSTEVFQAHSEALFDYLEEAMSLQTSTNAPRLEKRRLQEIRAIFEDVCRRMEELDLPETIVHGDMNDGNILTGLGHCQFIDWCEAYVGNPLISLQHLLLLNRVESAEIRAFMNRVLKERYRDVWTAMCDPEDLEDGLVYMPVLAAASALYGRGDWLTTPQRDETHRQAHARCLARHMDRAARAPELLLALRS